MTKEQMEIFEAHADAVCNECVRQQLAGNCEGCIVDILCTNIVDEFVEEHKDD